MEEGDVYDVDTSPSNAAPVETRQPDDTKDGGPALVPNEKWWAKQMDELEDVPDDVQAELSAEPEAMPERAAPEGLVVNLLPFQRESLWWMTRQEHCEFRGGILADEMGMGKTIQAIALICAHKGDPVLPPVGSGGHSHSSSTGAGGGGSPSCCEAHVGLPSRGPPPYQSEGTEREKLDWEKQVAKSLKAQAREAQKELSKAEKDAARAAKAEERAAGKAKGEAAEAKALAKAAEKEAARVQKKAEKEAAKAVKAAEKEAAKAEKAAAKGASGSGKGSTKKASPAPTVPASMQLAASNTASASASAAAVVVPIIPADAPVAACVSSSVGVTDLVSPPVDPSSPSSSSSAVQGTAAPPAGAGAAAAGTSTGKGKSKGKGGASSTSPSPTVAGGEGLAGSGAISVTSTGQLRALLGPSTSSSTAHAAGSAQEVLDLTDDSPFSPTGPVRSGEEGADAEEAEAAANDSVGASGGLKAKKGRAMGAKKVTEGGESTGLAGPGSAFAAAVAAASAAGLELPQFTSSWAPLAAQVSPLDVLAPPQRCFSTLVICPVIALTQWRSEILKHTAPGTLRVTIYHGPQRNATADDLMSYDVVLTTYSILEAEFRRMMEPSKVECQWCGKLFLLQKLRIHQRYFCGPDAQKTAAQAKQEKKKPRLGAGGAEGAGTKAKWSESHAEKSPSATLAPVKGGKVQGKGQAKGKRVIDDDDEEEEEEEEVVEVSSSSEEEEDMDEDEDDGFVRRGKGSSKPKGAGRGRKGGEKAASGGKAQASAGTSRTATVSGSSRRLVMPASTAPTPATSKGKGKGTPKSTGKGKGKGKGDSDEDDDEEEEFSDEEDDEEEDEEDDDDEEEDRKAGTKRKRSSMSKASPSSSAAGAGGGGSSVPMKLGPISVLQKVHWMRVILDESHAIKNKRAATTRAVYALTAERRWCLSGTPLQNRVSELFSMIRFLRVRPFAQYYCKNCPCQSMDYRFGQDGRGCEVCGHSPLRHYQWLSKYVMNPIKQWGYVGPGLEGMKILRHTVLDGLVLRRTKAGRAADLALPHRTIVLRNDLELDAFESDFYQALYTQSKSRFGAYVTQGTLLQNYAHLFDLLTRLRQAVDHPYLILYGAGATESGQGLGDAGAGTGSGTSGGGGGGLQDVCGICRESAEDPVLTGCRHVFCRMCMRAFLESLGGNAALSLLKDRTNDEDAWVGGGDEDEEEQGGEGAGAGAGKGKSSKGKKKGPKASPAPDSGSAEEGLSAQPTCPKCYAPLTVDLLAAPLDATHAASGAGAGGGMPSSRRGILSRIPKDRVGVNFKSSSKIEALLQDLWSVQTAEPGAKALVFSQFVSMLDLVEHRLTHAGVRCVKLDGGMTVAARDRVINAFRDDPHVTVFLISLKAGGVALNLTSASHIYLMDPWWNPAAEFQALDRTHRLGQHRSITATRFIVSGTVEERIIALQDKKRLVFEGTVGADAGALARLTEEDMRFLFQ